MFADRCLELEFIDTGNYTPQEYDEFLREIILVRPDSIGGIPFFKFQVVKKGLNFDRDG